MIPTNTIRRQPKAGEESLNENIDGDVELGLTNPTKKVWKPFRATDENVSSVTNNTENLNLSNKDSVNKQLNAWNTPKYQSINNNDNIDMTIDNNEDIVINPVITLSQK